MTPGLLDTNVFLHAQTTDALSEECRAFLRGLETGEVTARLEPFVLHELSYALRHYLKGATRQDIARYLLVVLQWEGVIGEKDMLEEAVQVWQASEHVGFVDALLAARARETGCPIYTKNRRDFIEAGVPVPETLPS